MSAFTFLDTAREIVLRAGTIQNQRQASGFRVDKKGVTDLVTEVDLECERMCRSVLATRYPDHDVLAEELGVTPAGAAPSRFRWIFDPLDGTTNYAHGLPIFSSSLGLEVDGELVVGAIYDPSRRELFSAERGSGAWLNGERLRVSDAAQVIDALLVTGFPYDVQTRPEALVGLFTAFLTRARAVRRLGSAALDLAYVAAGRFDGFWEQQLRPWDMAAGALLVTEAGGRVTKLDGSAFRVEDGSLLASNGVLHPALVEIASDYQARRATGA